MSSLSSFNFPLVVQCPAHDVRYDSSGVILSPGWPESYPNLQMCSWSVTVEKGYNVTITFESFHTEKEFDMLEIFDGKNKTHPTHKNMSRSTGHKVIATKTNTEQITIYFALPDPFVLSLSFSTLLPFFPLTSSWSLSGPTANSPILATLSGDLPTPFNLTTSGHQFLVRWSSDHGTNKKGFKIRYVGEYQSMYPNFILLLLYTIIMHG